MARALIITSYMEYALDIPALLRSDDYIVCLDGGFEIAEKQGISPDLVLGDFDSLRDDARKRMQNLAGSGAFELRQYPPEKDYTDLELAFRILDPAKTPQLLVIGGLGGRLDMTLVNVQMLQKYTGAKFRRIEMMDGHHYCFVVHGEIDRCPADGEPGLGVHTIPRRENSYLSLLPLTDVCRGVTLQGVKYPLQEAELHRGASLSVSNEFQADQATLQIRHGSLLVIVTREDNAVATVPGKRKCIVKLEAVY